MNTGIFLSIGFNICHDAQKSQMNPLVEGVLSNSHNSDNIYFWLRNKKCALFLTPGSSIIQF